MKIVSFFIVAFCLAQNYAAAMSQVFANSTIEQVTVYEDRAKIERVAEENLPAGKAVVIFTNLPLAIDRSSVNVSGASKNQTKILGIEIREEYLEAASNPAVEQLKTEIQTVSDRKKILTDENAMWGEQLDFLRKARQSSSETESSQANRFEELRKLYEFQQQEISRILERQREITVLLRPIDNELARLQQELDRVSSGDATQSLQVLVAVESDQATEAKLLLSYVIGNASWSPEYTARVNTDQSTVELSTYGVVQQGTGEDWSDVKLWLSTARPSIGGRMPDLHPQWINLFEPRPSVAKDGVYKREARASAPMPMMEVAEEVQSNFAAGKLSRDQKSNSILVEGARLDSRGFNTVFEIKMPTTIPSDGEAHKNMIGVKSFTSKLDYVTTPKLAELAYLRAKLTNTTEFPLLAGTVNLFRDGDFVGKSHVNFIAAGAGFDFYLGVDDAIKITRKILKDQAGESGLVSKKKTLSHQYEITVENFRNKTQTITVFDQIPVLKNEAIRLEDVSYTPKPTETKDETGEVNWQLQVPAGKKETVKLGYQIEWPSDKNLSGI
ncbi:MAG: mucoidy inhibitor MuiA family protein [Verrucomicrobiae bacterium]|nr:mucoidy inhibitor MuiA family protein [Verrucomicrobiae bacterium]